MCTTQTINHLPKIFWPSTVRSGEWPAWFSVWFPPGCWRALAKGTARRGRVFIVQFFFFFFYQKFSPKFPFARFGVRDRAKIRLQTKQAPFPEQASAWAAPTGRFQTWSRGTNFSSPLNAACEYGKQATKQTYNPAQTCGARSLRYLLLLLPPGLPSFFFASPLPRCCRCACFSGFVDCF